MSYILLWWQFCGLSVTTDSCSDNPVILDWPLLFVAVTDASVCVWCVCVCVWCVYVDAFLSQIAPQQLGQNGKVSDISSFNFCINRQDYV